LPFDKKCPLSLKVEFAHYKSPIGNLLIAADQCGITRLSFPNLLPDNTEEIPDQSVANNHLQSLTAELDAYFSGELIHFKTKLNPAGTPFQKQVWTALQQISHGSTATYGEIARAIGNPNASRAVGLANNRNPIPIIVPCHRVVGASGKMVGYAGEIWRKEWLLEHEGVLLPNLS